MLHLLRSTYAALLSLFIFILGNGLFTTLLVVRLHQEGQSSFMIGAVTSFYYVGFIIASLKVERFISRVGHIRSFAAFASGLAVLSIVHGIFVIPWLWLVMRLLGGFFVGGIFIVIESWLLSLGTIKTRGQIIALYMVTLYAGLALGQFLINVGSTESLLLFAITAMLCSLAVIPLALSKAVTPEMEEPSTLNFIKLYKATASSVIGCIAGGLILGSIYGLLPLFISQKTGDESAVAFFMFMTIFGGMALQYPIGRLSDLIERRTVLAGVSFLTVIFALITVVSFAWFWVAAISLFFFGGLSFTIYPISISHACDGLENKDIVSGTQALSLAYSIGAASGLFIAPLFVHSLGANGLFIYFVIIAGSLGMFLMWRRSTVAPQMQEEKFIATPVTTPIMSELDPRGEES